jgi:hypothetical protein
MSVTRQTFAANVVKAIDEGCWTTEFPSWADEGPSGAIETEMGIRGNVNPHHVRAVWTAEAFIHVFQWENPRFNRDTFLDACGLRK